MGDSHYLHYTEYKFSPPEFKKVIRAFREIVNDVSVRCHYVVESDAFSIICPPSLGMFADSTLADIIAAFLKNEKKESELHMQSLMQIAMDGKDAAAPDGFALYNTPTTMQHTVNAEGHQGCLIKLFTLDQLPQELFSRSLGPDTQPDSLQARKQGLTCRVVRHDLQSDKYIFNSRFGQALPSLGATAEAALLALAIFVHIGNRSDEPMAKTKTQIPVVTIIQNPEVSKWLHDSAEPIKQISPDIPSHKPWATIPDAPNQLIRYNADSTTTPYNVSKRGKGSKNSFQSYGMKFAVVDTIGLTGTPAEQAKWETENYVSKKPTLHGSGSHVRQSSFSRSQHGSKMSIQESDWSSVLQRSNATTALESSAASNMANQAPHATLSGEPRWTNQVVQPAATEGNLIDDSSTKVPIESTHLPGEQPQSQNKLNSTPFNKDWSTRPTVPKGPQKNKGKSTWKEDWAPPTPMMDAEPRIESLIDFDQDEDNLETPSQLDGPKVPPGGYLAGSEPLKPIVERIHIPDEPILRYTMNQQARRSKNKPLSFLEVPANLVTQLPKPEPRVPVQRKERPVTSDAVQEVKHKETTDIDDQKIESVRSNDCLTTVSLDSDSETNLPGLNTPSNTARRCDFIDDSFIKVQFGMALVWKDDKFFKRGSYPPEALQQKLNADSDYPLHMEFVSKLSTSTSDACHLLDLVPGSMSKITTSYEVEVRTSGGIISRFEFQPCIAHHTAIVTSSFAMLEERYRHYPYRVWDAHIGSYKETIVPNGASEFVASMQSLEPPSFCARVPNDGFTVEKVFALRTYEKTLPLGVLHVTDVQELFLESIDANEINLKATCKEREAMIEQQRQWWEAGLSFRGECLSTEDIFRVADELLYNMDGIGFHNTGPLFKKNVETKKEEVIPYW